MPAFLKNATAETQEQRKTFSTQDDHHQPMQSSQSEVTRLFLQGHIRAEPKPDTQTRKTWQQKSLEQAEVLRSQT